MEQKAVVDVFSGKSDNQKFSVEREDGKKQTYLLKQGNEEKAGASIACIGIMAQTPVS